MLFKKISKKGGIMDNYLECISKLLINDPDWCFLCFFFSKFITFVYSDKSPPVAALIDLP